MFCEGFGRDSSIVCGADSAGVLWDVGGVVLLLRCRETGYRFMDGTQL